MASHDNARKKNYTFKFNKEKQGAWMLELQ